MSQVQRPQPFRQEAANLLLIVDTPCVPAGAFFYVVFYILACLVRGVPISAPAELSQYIEKPLAIFVIVLAAEYERIGIKKNVSPNNIIVEVLRIVRV